MVAPIEVTYSDADEMFIPPNWNVVGWDKTTATFNAKKGTTLIAGHVNSQMNGFGALGVIHQAERNMVIKLTDNKGRTTLWKVVSVEKIAKTPGSLPADLWATKGPRRLALVTCGGTVAHRHYDSNVVLLADPVE
jgi:hypothetical protein